MLKNLPAKIGDADSIPGSGRSPGEGNGNPLQYSCLEDPMDRGAGGLQSAGSQRVGHDGATEHTALFTVACCVLCCIHVFTPLVLEWLSC